MPTGCNGTDGNQDQVFSTEASGWANGVVCNYMTKHLGDAGAY